MRDIFGYRRGLHFRSLDFEQAEMRTLAHLAKTNPQALGGVLYGRVPCENHMIQAQAAAHAEIERRRLRTSDECVGSFPILSGERNANGDLILNVDIREQCEANMSRAMREENHPWYPPAGLACEERDEDGYRVHRLPLAAALDIGGKENKTMHEILIKPALNGWIARVGCQTLVYVDKAQMLKDLGEYLEDPQKKQEEVLKGAVNVKITLPGWSPTAPVAAGCAGDAPVCAGDEPVPAAPVSEVRMAACPPG